MSAPVLWTRDRKRRFAWLAGIGFIQAAAALLLAAAATRLLADPGAGAPLLMVAAAGGAVALVVLRTLQRRVAEAFALSYVADLRIAIVSHTLRAPFAAPAGRLGLVMTRVVNDLSAIKLWLSDGLAVLPVGIVVLVSVAGYLAAVEPVFLAVLALPVLIWVAVVGAALRPLARAIKESRRRRGRIASMTAVLLSARPTLLVHGRHGSLVRSISRRSGMMSRALVHRATASGVMRAASDLIVPFAALAAVAFAASDGLPAEKLGLLILVAAIAIQHLNAFAMALEYRLASNVARARLSTVFAAPVLDIEEGDPFLPETGVLEVEDVPIGEGGRRASFGAEEGEVIALEGLSACEATALFWTLARLDNPEPGGGGRIAIGGAQQAGVRARDWWRAVTLVSASLPHLPGKLEDEVCLGDRSGMDALERARLLARFGLPQEALDARTGDGRALSQSDVAAARCVRAVLRSARVVLVDDQEVLGSGKLLGALLDELAKQRTTVVLARPRAAAAGMRTVDLAEAAV